MNFRFLPLVLTTALLCTPLSAAENPGAATDRAGNAVERIVWRGSPIRVDLKLGAERIIEVPGAGHLRAGLLGGPVPGLRVQVLGNRAYLLAKEPFASTRMLLQPDTGQPVLLDLAADKRFSAGPDLAILTGSVPAESAPAAAPAATAAPGVPGTPAPVGYVALVRHAAQSLYAPERLIPRSRAIVSAPLQVRQTIPILRGGHFDATPVASWRAKGADGPLWVTAVKLENLMDEPVVLDPRDLRGVWRAAGFQHARLAPFGDEADTTTVYLISSKPFHEVIAPWLPKLPPLVPAQPPGDDDQDQARADHGVLDQ